MKKLKHYLNHAVMPSIISYLKRIMISQPFTTFINCEALVDDVFQIVNCVQLYRSLGLMEDFMIILVGDQ